MNKDYSSISFGSRLKTAIAGFEPGDTKRIIQYLAEEYGMSYSSEAIRLIRHGKRRPRSERLMAEAFEHAQEFRSVK